MLVLHKVAVRHGADFVLQNLSLQSNAPGLLFIVGSGGAGKSTLLAALAADRSAQGMEISGLIELDGRALDQNVISWISQNSKTAHARTKNRDSARQYLSVHNGIDAADRLAEVLAGLERDAAIYLVDESTAGLAPDQIDQVRQQLLKRSRQSLVVVATHNRQDCLTLGGRTALLAGGCVQECLPTEEFFVRPKTLAGRLYVETGNCNLPRDTSQQPKENGVWWVVPGLLCGMSRPGLISEIEEQCAYLREGGVRRILCLEERCTYALAPFIEKGIGHHHFRVPDMAPLTFSQAVDLCRIAEGSIRNNEGVAVHCRGGLGRTGTGLAAIFVWFGDSATAAIERIRRVEPFAIQSNSQTRFIHEFAERIRGWQSSPI